MDFFLKDYKGPGSGRLTSSVFHIVDQIVIRASERGLDVVDETSILMLTLWSILLWERKVGLIALERSGVNRFGLARGVNALLDEKEKAARLDKRQRTRSSIVQERWDLATLIEPLLRTAEIEAQQLGHNYIGSEHLILSLLRQSPPELSSLLKLHGANHEQVKQSVVQLLGG